MVERCRYCNAELEENALYCSECGNRVEEAWAAAQAAKKPSSQSSRRYAQNPKHTQKQGYVTKWYLSIPILLLTGYFFFPASIVLTILRLKDFKKQPKKYRRNMVIYLICVVLFFLLGIILITIPSMNEQIPSTDNQPTLQQSSSVVVESSGATEPSELVHTEPEEPSTVTPSTTASPAEVETTAKPTEATPTERATTGNNNPFAFLTSKTTFSKPNILDGVEIRAVKALAKDRAVLIVEENNKNYAKYYDLKRQKSIMDVSDFIDSESLEYGYLCYSNFDPNTWSGDTFWYTSDGKELLCYPETGITVNTAFYDRKQYVGVRDVTSLDYSGKEFALISFDGKVIVDWMRIPSFDGTWEHLGDGMFLAGSDTLVDMFNGQISKWPTIIYESSDGFVHKEYEYAPSIMYTGKAGLINSGYDAMSIMGRTPFNGDFCTVYMQYNSGSDSSSELHLYTITRDGTVIYDAPLPPIDYVEYVDARKELYLVSYDQGGSVAKNLRISTSSGTTVLSLGDSLVTSVKLNDDVIIIIEASKGGTTATEFVSVYDYNGNQLLAPILYADSNNAVIFADSRFYAILNKETGISIYNLEGKLLHEIKQIKSKEKGLLFKSEQTYQPEEIAIYDDYYVVKCHNVEKKDYRYFIGKLS